MEEERESEVPSGWLSDVHNGNNYMEGMDEDIQWCTIPGNMLFMLSIDWFQPFERTQYSIGVIYLVIQNLPRSVRFKPENIIIVSAIPGPKEQLN